MAKIKEHVQIFGIGETLLVAVCLAGLAFLVGLLVVSVVNTVMNGMPTAEHITDVERENVKEMARIITAHVGK